MFPPLMEDPSQILRLPDLREGQSGIVIDFRSLGPIKQRLMELGVVTGARIECVQKCRCGDPIAFGIKGAVIALRNDDSRQIFVVV